MVSPQAPMASSLPPCRFPIRIWVCHTCEPSCAHRVQRVEAPDRLLLQSRRFSFFVERLSQSFTRSILVVLELWLQTSNQRA
jgi:hypothetical protein